jgi:hypothetical protein
MFFILYYIILYYSLLEILIFHNSHLTRAILQVDPLVEKLQPVVAVSKINFCKLA